MQLPPGLTSFGDLYFYVFPASQLGVYAGAVVPGAGYSLVSPTQILQASGAVAAMTGTAYNDCSRANCAVPVFLEQDNVTGVSTPGIRPGDGVTISVAGGVATASPANQVAPAANVAVQLYPALVAGGQVSTVADNGQNSRAALGIVDQNNLAFIVAQNMSMPDFAGYIQSAGITDAGYTDGGDETALVLPGSTVGSGMNKAIPTWLIVNPSGLSVPSWIGTGFAVVGVAAAVAAGVVFFNEKKR